MIIRQEAPSDIEAITQVTVEAFADHPYSRQTEQFIITSLRAAGALTVSLVAEVDGAVVGHVAFSPVTISGRGRGWYGVGPVSVLPSRQRQGIGTTLMNEGMRRLKSAGAKGCVLVGDPRFYERFGFCNHPGLVMDHVPAENLLALPFGLDVPKGAVAFHGAFMATGD